MLNESKVVKLNNFKISALSEFIFFFAEEGGEIIITMKSFV